MIFIFGSVTDIILLIIIDKNRKSFCFFIKFITTNIERNFITFLGRLDDISVRGTELIEEIAEMFAAAGDIDTQIICASVRNPMHVTECALAGADIATVPYKVIEQMTHHPLTDAGIAKFQADYKAVFGE